MSTLQYNTTGEPFVRLPAPFSNIIITPPRISDAEASAAILSEDAVSQWLGPTGPGSAYTVAQAESWLTKLKAQTDALVEELGGATEPHGVVSGCPLRHIREERADGTEVFLGDVGLVRSNFSEIRDTEERARLVAENNARVAGDPEIVWHISYYLAPSHHGRGLMTVIVKTIIAQFGLPWMKVKRIRPGTFQDNHGSLKVLQKSGFVVVDTLVDHVQVGAEKKTQLVLEWRGLDSAAS
ncbi:GNAT domain-containing protein [Mycena albidolilacea]|uniref:GNAT domain-containing protein n=1 Tax=Mycena albidolilacea TaxID=1033008 RepID=A0AAD6Z521_9AGAR|nr:GNAT domain-containing protein [Mycena albidolilacea]